MRSNRIHPQRERPASAYLRRGKPIVARHADKPLLDAWPRGYGHGSFKLVPGGVLLSAKGMPELLIEEAVRKQIDGT